MPASPFAEPAPPRHDATGAVLCQQEAITMRRRFDLLLIFAISILTAADYIIHYRYFSSDTADMTQSHIILNTS